MQGQEQCDDGNTVQTDTCKNDCTLNVCGDNYILEGVETCDDGNTDNDDGCSNICLEEVPPLPDYVDLSGLVKRRQYTANNYQQYIVASAINADCNGDDTCTAAPSDAGGAYSITGLPPQSALVIQQDIQTGYENTVEAGITVPGSYAVRSKAATADQAAATQDLYWVNLGWLHQVAVDCGVYDAGDYDAQANPTYVNGHPDWTIYSAVVGQLKDAQGNGVAGIPEGRIEIDLGGYVNNNTDYVCFLYDNGAGQYAYYNGTTSQASGMFVYFKAKNAANNGTGAGNAYARVTYQQGQTNFAEASIPLNAGMVGLVTLYTDDNPNPNPPVVVDNIYFTDVLQILQNQGCTACHTEGGPGDVQTGGYYARFDVGAQEVYDNLTGPGTNCNGGTTYRVCIDDPTSSYLLSKPLLEDPPNHPNASFSDENDPDYQTLLAWIEQGAPFYLPVVEVNKYYTLYGVMDVAQQRGCTGCHGYETGYSGGLSLDGCIANLDLNDDGTDDYVAAGIELDPAVNPYYKQDCVYYHLRQQTYGPNYANDNTDTIENGNPYGYQYRVDYNNSAQSMLLYNPYCGPTYCADDPDYPETHPVKVFANDQDPGYTAVYSWIDHFQAASRTAIVDDYGLNADDKYCYQGGDQQPQCP